ncbi:MAG: tRNA preQ1(34) S-adenosylmethionine ribosyltransferase-isomerase QueA, partial [Myxococcota bacterium]
MHLDHLHYVLPAERIAQEPPAQRDASKMMQVSSGTLPKNRHITELPERLPSGTLLIVNDTRVVPARLIGQRPSGGRVELLLIEPVGSKGWFEAGSNRFLAMGRANRPMLPGSEVEIPPCMHAKIVRRRERGMLEIDLRFEASHRIQTFEDALIECGEVPLPPYIRRKPSETDRKRYQTVFSEKPGAVAAPTAGLHLTHALIEKLRSQGHELAQVTLHVGPGTFVPVKTKDLDDHVMHSERYEVPQETAEQIQRAKNEGRLVLAVGTTVVRALEAASMRTGQLEAGAGQTDLLIQPGHQFRTVDALLTNFHLPGSTLLALVMALAGIETIQEAYALAIERKYRFLSYGDAMLILPKQ